MRNSLRWLALLLVLAGVLAHPALGHAQGCSMCRDTAAGSAPKMRRALRVAIPMLGVPAAMVFAGMLTVAFRFPTRRRE